MDRGLPVDADPVGAGGEEVAQQPVRIGDHEMDVERQAGVPAQRRDHRDADGQVGHEVAVHDVDVQDIGAARLADAGGCGEVREVGGEKRGGDFDHGRAPWAAATTSEITSRRRRGCPGSGFWRRIVPSEIPS